ncbi:D-threo-aldose 1-dehydrogenase [Tranquillimonas rosea]|uniref:D-threo-aldose 1-dehydrogenase n=1 Tax=Tranquillimonas rosea TaxID=641238 RepID=A0A1H9WAQ3_9RHOB|nr:aldo/keto reductase [Tranquillimonas rosea]SES31022.1 D-threo-aldose 1-dehydrogenase [Tranquillimonas rosea]
MTDAHAAPPGPLGFGGAPLGNMFDTVDEDTARATLEAAWDEGVRYFDTAPHYGAGLSEHRFGEVLRTKPRDAFTLSTKVGRLLSPDPDGGNDGPFKSGLPFEQRMDYGYDATMRSLDDSFQRLGLARIDFVYIHDLAPDHLGDEWHEQFEIARDGAMMALTRLRDEGTIRGWGLGVNNVEPCERALAEADPDVFLLAGRYSLLNQPALERLFPNCVDRGVNVVVGGPYNSGLLAGRSTYDYAEAPQEMVDRRDRLDAICRRHDVDLRAAALQFCAAHPAVASVIPGAKGPDRVHANVDLMRATIPSGLWDEMKAEGLLPQDVPVPG